MLAPDGLKASLKPELLCAGACSGLFPIAGLPLRIGCIESFSASDWGDGIEEAEEVNRDVESPFGCGGIGEGFFNGLRGRGGFSS